MAARDMVNLAPWVFFATSVLFLRQVLLTLTGRLGRTSLGRIGAPFTVIAAAYTIIATAYWVWTIVSSTGS